MIGEQRLKALYMLNCGKAAADGIAVVSQETEFTNWLIRLFNICMVQG